MKLLLLLPLLLVACGAEVRLSLENQDWQLREIGGKPLPTGLRLIPELRFEKGQVTGHTGCNRLFGSYTAKGDTLKFGMLGSTRMACAPPQVEERVLQALNGVTHYRTSGRALDLLAADGHSLLHFVAKE